MTHPPKAPASETTPEPSALEKLEKMRDLTRRLVNVPKADLPTTRKPPKRNTHR